MRYAIRDRQNHVLGWIEEEHGLKRVKLTDRGSRTLGFFFTDRNVTVDDRGRVVGPGDQLLRLLRD